MEEMMGNKVGATTIFGALMDPEQKIQIVMDKEVADSEWYGCSDDGVYETENKRCFGESSELCEV